MRSIRLQPTGRFIRVSPVRFVRLPVTLRLSRRGSDALSDYSSPPFAGILVDRSTWHSVSNHPYIRTPKPTVPWRSLPCTPSEMRMRISLGLG